MEFLPLPLQLLGAALGLHFGFLSLLQALGQIQSSIHQYGTFIHLKKKKTFTTLTSFNVLLCFSSSEVLSSKSSWALSRFWVRSVSMWFSLLLSERVSRVLSRRSCGHTRVDIHDTMSHTLSPKRDFALQLTLYFSPPSTFDILLKVEGETWDFSFTFFLLRCANKLLSKSRDL